MSRTSANPPTPRLIRLRDAPGYLGMDKNRFNRKVRPCVTVIRIGTQGIAFDRIDLDAWADEHKSRNGCPAAQCERSKPWETKERQVSPSEVGSGISIVCRMALAAQNAEQDADAATLLQHGVGDRLFTLIRQIQTLATRCEDRPTGDSAGASS